MSLLLIFLLFITGILWRWYSSRKLPPGPMSVPIVGCLPFTNWSTKILDVVLDPQYYKYGDIVRFDYGIISFYMINDFQLSKNLFNKDSCSGRTELFDEMRSYHCKPKIARGIINNFGQSWTEQRRFSMRHLREFGYGRKSLELIIQEEANSLIPELLQDQEKNGEVLIENNFNLPILNVLWQLISSKRLSSDDDEIKKALDLLNESFQDSFVGLYMVFPFLTKILPPQYYAKAPMLVLDFLRKEVLEQEKMHDPDVPPRNFIEVYLKEIEKGENEDFHREQLVNICWDFFAAGSETTSTYLKWALLFMAIHQDVQRKCQKEIDEVLGEKKADKEDQAKLIYVNATMNEIFRLASVAPASLFHVPREDIHVGDYIIPQGSNVMCNLMKFSKDPKIFPNPSNFDPQRFIEGDKPKTYKELIPFGIGKRVCMGESLARTSSFIFFVTILQHINISPAKNRPNLSPKNFKFTLTSNPNPYYVTLEKRN